MAPLSSLDVRCYRAALAFFPPRFRRDFGREMLRDVEEARIDVGAGVPNPWRFRAHIAGDLAQSLVREWWRSGALLVGSAAVACPILAMATLARLWPKSFVPPVPAQNDADVIGFEVLVVAVVLVIVSTVLFTASFMRTVVGHRRRELACSKRVV